eukprot:1169286-Amphidinium_carterae.1
MKAAVFDWASDELKEDSSFAVEAKKSCRIVKISMMSGRQTLICFRMTDIVGTEEALGDCCRKLGVSSTVSMCLVSSGKDRISTRKAQRTRASTHI